MLTTSILLHRGIDRTPAIILTLAMAGFATVVNFSPPFIPYHAQAGVLSRPYAWRLATQAQLRFAGLCPPLALHQ
jgi:hypothetical protein